MRPYVVGALRYVRSCGSRTVAVSCNPGPRISRKVDLAIEAITGPEVLTGSTRVKRIVCEACSCTEDVASRKLGEAKGGMKPAIMMLLLDCGAGEAPRAFDKAEGHVRQAL
ncbi:hypothetical protein [Olsenella profusa]|uniref:hypothetical protein n=1 Tax=Olsenella profusa TaxID=138595 RepID=UPI0027D7CF16|nr:hypothetical protein [Olsenella profusa]